MMNVNRGVVTDLPKGKYVRARHTHGSTSPRRRTTYVMCGDLQTITPIKSRKEKPNEENIFGQS